MIRDIRSLKILFGWFWIVFNFMLYLHLHYTCQERWLDLCLVYDKIAPCIAHSTSMFTKTCWDVGRYTQASNSLRIFKTWYFERLLCSLICLFIHFGFTRVHSNISLGLTCILSLLIWKLEQTWTWLNTQPVSLKHFTAVRMVCREG